MKNHRPFELKEYDPEWNEIYKNAAESLRPVFGDQLIEIAHIGSTSIAGMVAKPQVDILVVVKDLDYVKSFYADLKKMGFNIEGRGYVAPDDEYIHRDDESGKRILSVHILQEGNEKISEYKMFRDYLQNNEQDRDLYISTKRDLFEKYKHNYPEYDSQKRDVVNQIKERARIWLLSN